MKSPGGVIFCTGCGLIHGRRYLNRLLGAKRSPKCRECDHEITTNHPYVIKAYQDGTARVFWVTNKAKRLKKWVRKMRKTGATEY